MIDFRNIEIRFGDFVAIHDLSLEIKQGEFFTFLGPSGCGKTTTLRALVGFTPPSSGSISVDGEDITHKPIEKRGIGMVFQSYALFPTMTVMENITFGLLENRWSRADADTRVLEVARMVNLNSEQLAKNVSELSGGQQQRVAIARALALNPAIIVLDEPLSNLDAKLRKQLRVELKRIQKESGTTMVYVTHDQEEALTLSSRIAVFNNGYIEQVGTPREIYFSPANEFVCTFVGEANRLTRDVIEHINANNPRHQLDPDLLTYVRSEAVTMAPKHGVPEEDLIVIRGEFLDSSFYGVTTQSLVRVEDTEIRAVQVGDRGLKAGDRGRMWIHPNDILTFPKES